jgi:predicted O-linked N-acetylglucosamine transferase (SPINDLY family)
MTAAFKLTFALPGDTNDIAAKLAAQGGLAATPPELMANLSRAVGGLDLMGLVALAETARMDDAVMLYAIWLRAHGTTPAACAAWFNLGVLHGRAGNPSAAANAYRAALQIKPDMAEAAINLGTALEAMGQTDGALAAWRSALPTPALRQVLHNQLGRVLEQQGQLAPAAAELRASLHIAPDQPDVQQHMVHLRQRMMEWPVCDLGVHGLSLDTAALHAGPLAALALFDDPADQARVCADWIARKVPLPGGPLAPQHGYAHDRIRIGYLSTDFCRHAMSFLIAELLEQHDRTRFEVFGYCASPEDGSDIRARVIAAFDHFTVIKAMTDGEAAARIRADEIDVLIDLNGLTKGARPEILRWKPAPVQATYLGYIGPVPLPELDYLLCDDITIPPEHEAAYSPKPLRIKGCYQANDSTAPAQVAVSRQGEGLPEDAFVFSCASHAYKITPRMFQIWIEILQAVPNSVLWLVDDNPQAKAATQARWAQAGLDESRLIFAARVDPDRYRARLPLADLFLDTSPYNAGTIASDALRMGLPIVTLQGQAFSARMASSLLTAVGLPQGITRSPEEYKQTAIGLAQNPDRLAAMKARLAAGAWHKSLGDAKSFTQRFEAAIASVALKGP